jgi:hypothetical protein
MSPRAQNTEDVSMPGQLGRLAVPAVSVLLALVLLAALAVAALRPGTASAATVLLRGAGVVATLPDGSASPLAEGDEVPRGSVVAAGRDGAVLRTRGRDTWLSGDAEVRVADGARQELRAGFVMVDARRGPALELTTAAAAVTTPAGAVSRVERGALLRVGSYTGDALQVRAAGRQATAEVARDYQVQVADGGLPGRATPLVLTPGDRYERALAADLVLADEALGEVARRLDAGGRADGLVLASFTAQLAEEPGPPLAPGAPGSERTLAYLLAQASPGDDVGDEPADALPDRFARVRQLRADGGSWGVVADLVAAEVPAVAALLDELLAPDAAETLAGEAGGDVDISRLLGLPGSDAAPAPPPAAPGPAPAPPGGAPAPPPAAPPPPGEDPAPAPAPVPVPEPIDTVVDTVLGLLPSAPGDDALDPADVTVPSLPGDPEPSPTPTSGGLLGLLP